MNVTCRALPRVVPAGGQACIRVSRLGEAGSPVPGRTYSLRLFSKVNRTEDFRFEEACGEDGVLRCALELPSAGEYVLDVLCPAGEEDVLGSVRLFAVQPALAHLRPQKGDLHMHTDGSDGRDSPLEMALRSRQAGMDFIAVTDHDNYAPSQRAIEDAQRLGLPLLVLPGEEVTVRELGGHILSLNASAGVGELRHEPAEDERRRRILDEEIAGRDLVPPLTPELYSHAVWTVRKVGQLGGCAVLAHPYWEGTTRKYYPPRALVEQLLADGLCEGIELLGGSPTTEGNRLAIAKYCRDASGGQLWPVIAGSDAHSTDDSLGEYWTLAFVPELTAETVLSAIRDFRTVACQRLAGREVTIYGPIELVEYAYFLQREFFPLHDRLCRLQGRLYARRIEQGADEHVAARATLRRALRELYRSFWADGLGETQPGGQERVVTPRQRSR